MGHLPEEIVEEILVRLPPAEPASLLRAATVHKSWCRIISDPGFRRKFVERHRTAPVLGFVGNLGFGMADYTARFVPATPFRRSEHRDRRVLDSRHGRVLLTRRAWEPELEVWDPVTDELRELPELPLPSDSDLSNEWNAAVVCADYGARDHLDCRGKPFLVVFLDAHGERMRVHLYSSEVDAWSEPSYGPPSPDPRDVDFPIPLIPSALVGNALYFLTNGAATNIILKYDLATRNMSVIHLPDNFASLFKLLMPMGDGGLGFAMVHRPTSALWVCSVQPDPNGDDFLVQVRSIELGFDELYLDDDDDYIAFAPGVEVLYVWINDGWFTINLESGQVGEQVYCGGLQSDLIPYMSFYTPDLRQYV